MDSQEEAWAEIAGYDGYSVSSLGRVRRDKTGKIIKGVENGLGYLVLNLYRNGKCKNFLVHRLVAKVFLEIKRGKRIVNHIDGCRANNAVSNLEWVTARQNSAHAVNIGNMGGNKCGMSKLSKADVAAIRNLFAEGLSMKVIAEKFKISAGHAGLIIRSSHWTDREGGAKKQE